MTTATTSTPVVIDVFGTVNQMFKWLLLQVVYLLIALVLMALAPLLFTVGAEYLAYKFPQYASTWAVVYLAVGPWFCAAWMSPISHFPDWVREHRMRKAGMKVKKDMKTYALRFGRGVGYMFLGLVGSYLAEAGVTYWAHSNGMIPNHLMLFFAIAPFAVFAPCWLIVVKRMLSKKEEGFIYEPSDIS